MFSSLIPPTNGSLEFTPIGKRLGRGENNAQRVSPLGRYSGNNDTTFDTTEEFTGKTRFSEQSPRLSQQGTKATSQVLPNNGLAKDFIVGETGTSVQSLNGQIDKLHKENYNLKFEVASLTQYLKGTPEEQQQVVFENMELKKQLRDALNTPQNVLEKGVIDEIKRLHIDAISLKDSEINRLQEEIRRLANKLPVTKVPQELYDRLESLQVENQSLRREVADESRGKEYAYVQENNNELSKKLKMAEARQSDMTGEIAALKEKLSECARDLETAEKQRDQGLERIWKAEKATKSMQEEIDELKEQNRHLTSGENGKTRYMEEQLQGQIRRLKETLKKSSGDYEDQIEKRSREISELRQEIRRLEGTIRDHEQESERAKRRIASLEQSLQEKQDMASFRREKTILDNTSAKKMYEDEIHDLQQQVEGLKADKWSLETEMAKFEEEARTASFRCDTLEKETAEFQQKFDFYEKEYAVLAEEVDQKDQRLRALENLLLMKDADLRFAERGGFGDYEKIRMEEKQAQLERHVETLEQQIKKGQNDLDDARKLAEKLASEKQQAVSDSFDQTLKVRDLQAMQSKLETKIRDKEEIIEALETRLRHVSHDFRIKSYSDDKYGVRADLEYEVTSLQRDKARIEKELSQQQSYYESKISSLSEKYRQELNANESAIVALLEGQLEDARKEIRALTTKEKDLQAEIDTLNKKNRNSDLQDQIWSLEERLRTAHKDKSRLQQVIDTLETDERILQLEKTQQELKIKNLDLELSKTTRHCHRLAKKLNDMDIVEYRNSFKDADELLKAKKANSLLQAQVDQLTRKLSSFRVGTPKNKSALENKLAQNELLFFKAKLYESQMKLKDLWLVNSFVMTSIKNADEAFKNELAKTALIGIFPDFEEPRKKVTFKVVAKFVLASVRMRKRAEKADIRRSQLLQLREDIERDKLTLKAE